VTLFLSLETKTLSGKSDSAENMTENHIICYLDAVVLDEVSFSKFSNIVATYCSLEVHADLASTRAFRTFSNVSGCKTSVGKLLDSVHKVKFHCG
jgi:hypothetical protein